MRKHLSTPEKRNVIFDGKRTTLQLELYVWQNVERIASQTNQPLDDILTDIRARKQTMPMAQAVRLFALLFYESYVAILSGDIALDQDQPPYQLGHSISTAEPADKDSMMRRCYGHVLAQFASATKTR